MALNLPVITSDLPLYQKVIESNKCGFCISPFDASALFGVLEWLISNPAEAQAMGQNGRRAAMQQYNWDSEEKAILHFYGTILNN